MNRTQVNKVIACSQPVAAFVRMSPGQSGSEPRWRPKLASGWRAEFVGRLFEDLLSGKTSVRIGDPALEFPLIIES